MSERITQGLRDAMATGARITEFDGYILDETIWANRAEFENLCDAIDAIHANLERENDRLKCELDRVTGEMEEHHAWAPESHYVMLPKDADGVPWHIGDMTENKQTVQGMCLDKHGWHFLGTVNDIDPSIHRHHHAPTVEDVLREFAMAVCKDDALTIRKDVVDEYAAKLQLKEDA